MAKFYIVHWDLGDLQDKAIYASDGTAFPYKWWSSFHDSANGWSVAIAFRIEETVKTINYADVYVTAIDNVGGVANVYPGQSSTFLHCIGPYFANQLNDGISDTIWWFSGILNARFDKVVLTYSDGTKEELPVTVLAERKDGTYWREEKNKKTKKKSNGCYVATCVYGSYDCPQVWTLRRFRDYSLARTRAGRAFIRMYYFLSPKVIRIFGNNKWFHVIWRNRLDRLVNKLKEKGYSDLPYSDA